MSGWRSSRWLPLLLSAFVYPGAGQFLQRRTGWGLAYAISFTLFAGLSIVVLAPPLLHLYRALYEGKTPAPVDWRMVLRPLALAVAVFASNLYDAWWHTVKPAPPPQP